jgi:chromosome segregation ATPase
LGELEERQYLKQLEDMITDLMTAVDSSLDICSVLQAKHAQYAEEPAQRRAQPSQQHHALFNQVIAEKEREFRHYRAQVDVLRMRIRSAEALVRRVTIQHDSSSDYHRSRISLTLVMATP